MARDREKRELWLFIKKTANLKKRTCLGVTGKPWPPRGNPFGQKGGGVRTKKKKLTNQSLTRKNRRKKGPGVWKRKS